MGDRLRFLLGRLGERLWIKPLVLALVSTAAVFLARLIDRAATTWLPDITQDSVETLLSIMASSMLVIATFAVSSMVSAYASAGSSATPRSFPVVIADDSSQNALSTFVGAFIFSIIALVASKNGYYDESGWRALFVLTLVAFALVILTFVRWVDRIARLGRLGNTVRKVEDCATRALRWRREAPHLRGVPMRAPPSDEGEAVHGPVGYVQRVDVAALQTYAQTERLRIAVTALPGTFSAPGRPLARVTADSGAVPQDAAERVIRHFVIGAERTFEEDPRFGLIVLSEIASRALSPAVNDAGTAIGVIGTFVRLFQLWSEPPGGEPPSPEHDRIEVPGLDLEEMLGDAFRAIARDGAAIVEVGVRLQKAFAALASTGHAELRAAAIAQSRQALARAEKALALPNDLTLVQELARQVG